jgi:hypothetical protein
MPLPVYEVLFNRLPQDVCLIIDEFARQLPQAWLQEFVCFGAQDVFLLPD